jgi:Putative lactococcus lactis phage r1t holin
MTNVTLFTDRAFWVDAAERAVMTAAQAAAALFIVGVTILTIDWAQGAAVAATAGLLSVLKSVAVYRVGAKGTPAILPTATPEKG